jgi:hypothetical protein
MKNIFKTFNEDWVDKNEPSCNTSRINELGWWYDEYQKVKSEFKNFLHTTECVTDENQNKLTPIQIYNVILDYQIRIQKLWFIIEPKMYQTLNTNKTTGVKYIAIRAMWIDQYGEMFKRFSKNLGAENKIMVGGKIPKMTFESVKETITYYMQELYSLEYSVSIKTNSTHN